MHVDKELMELLRARVILDWDRLPQERKMVLKLTNPKVYPEIKESEML